MTLSDVVAGEIRSRLARNGSSIRGLADTLEVRPAWLYGRIGATGRDVSMSLDDLERIADALGCEPIDLLPPQTATLI